MQASAIAEAARLLVAARRDRHPLRELPPGSRPASFADAIAVQNEIVRLLGETVPAYKVAGATPEAMMWAPIIGSRSVANPGTFPAADVPLLGIEAEIAYRLKDDVTAADRAMTGTSSRPAPSSSRPSRSSTPASSAMTTRRPCSAPPTSCRMAGSSMASPGPMATSRT